MPIMSSICDLSMGMSTSELVLYSVDAWLFTGFWLGPLLVNDTHTQFTKYFGCCRFQPHALGGNFVTHYFGHSGDVSIVLYLVSHKDFLLEKSGCCLLPKNTFLRWGCLCYSVRKSLILTGHPHLGCEILTVYSIHRVRTYFKIGKEKRSQGF
jgi:hypothetical protein